MIVESMVIAAWILIHLYGGRLRWLGRMPRSNWLSFAGGVAVAYVFVHLLPELAAADESIQVFAHTSAWMLALGGMVLFYGLEHCVRRRRPALQTHPAGIDQPRADGAFWLHVAAFAVYNIVIALLLHHRSHVSVQEEVLFGAALGLHFVVNDAAMRSTHAHLYDHFGRWLLVAALLSGFLLGFAWEASEAMSRSLLAVVAGGVVLNVLKEELPQERKSRFLPFLLGAGAYAALLQLMD